MRRATSLRLGTGVVAAALAGTATAQVVNGDFETNALAPWVVTDTAQGRSYANGVYQVDIDQPGPLATSPAAGFIVGQRTANTGLQGIQVTQSVMLTGGAPYRLGFDWQVYALVSFYGASGGVFDLIVDGVSLGQFAAPVVASGTRVFGRIEAMYTPPAQPAMAMRNVGVRISRPVLAGEEQFQYIDNFFVRPACPPDFNNSGGVTVQDVFDFLAAYFAGDPRADFNRVGGISLQDIFDFLAAYFAGC